MHKDQRDLIIQLCTQVGMEMEDAATRAITMGGLEGEELGQAFGRLEASSNRIAALIAAAKALTDPKN